MRIRSLLITVVLGIAGGATGALVTAAPAAAAPAFVYATFKGDAVADEELWLYSSPNATSFSVMADTNYRGPSGVLRDPSIIEFGGRYYVAYTVQSWTTNSTTFNIASSPDLRTWTHVTTVNSGIADTRFVWAPEFYVEGSTVRIIASVAQTTCSACFRPYVYTAQNTALTSWSGPVQMTGLGFNHIDTFVVKSGSTYHAFVKNETSKFIEHWTGTAVTSGWTLVGTLWTSGHEGPSVIQQTDGSWRIYIDRYTNGGIWTATSSNLNSWTGLSAVSCAGCRHGTVIRTDVATGPAFTSTAVAQHSGKCVDAVNSTAANPLAQNTCSGNSLQSWRFQAVGADTYTIVNAGSGQCIDVNGGSTANNAAIIQWTCNGAANQTFQLNLVSGKVYRLIATHSGKCIDVASASTADAARLIQFTCGTGTNQRFTLAGHP
jgi:ricin-type beta-trefoil lectin protein/glycosyl hydrolase family 43